MKPSECSRPAETPSRVSALYFPDGEPNGSGSFRLRYSLPGIIDRHATQVAGHHIFKSGLLTLERVQFEPKLQFD